MDPNCTQPIYNNATVACHQRFCQRTNWFLPSTSHFLVLMNVACDSWPSTHGYFSPGHELLGTKGQTRGDWSGAYRFNYMTPLWGWRVFCSWKCEWSTSQEIPKKNYEKRKGLLGWPCGWCCSFSFSRMKLISVPLQSITLMI